MQNHEYICSSTGLNEGPVKNVIKLLDEGSTIPFISRYRKEMTGGLDEVQVANIRDFYIKYAELLKRQQSILTSIEEQGKLTDDLESRIKNCFDSNRLEDIYLPFKQKKQTKAEKARKMGLTPLAKMIMSQRGGDPFQMAERFVKGEIIDEEMAIEGAKYIIAEWINENENLRERLRQKFEKRSILQSKLIKGKEEEGEKYRDYFEHTESLNKCASHRFLAIYRASREGILSLKTRPDDDESIELVERFFVKGDDECSDVVFDACKDAYRRLLRPSLENEVMNKAKEQADTAAIKVFAKNLRQLLLSAPLGQKRILAIDPGFRTGCKVVCIDENGSLLTNTTIFPHPPQKEESKAKAKIAQLVESYKIDAIAIGDGTAGRETERLIRQIRFNSDVLVFVVREDGASIYSASDIARKEFPDYDVTVRGAVSIGRRLMDPLAELVKIDPKSVGVGQYQHEVNQSLLKASLDDVVVSCVNNVGVDLNTASPYLLSYVSGLGPAIADNIVAFRSENGGINSIEELKKVKRLGDKAFEQSAGFLRVRNGKNPLDNSAVHPESYHIVESMARKSGVTVDEIIGNTAQLQLLEKDQFPEIDVYTYEDILSELKKPGRDPRKQAKVLEFDSRIKTLEDLKVGMMLPGIVTNVTNFGAFVNIGIKENGLIHKSKLADVYVEDPSEFISLHEHVEVRVLQIDLARKRVGLEKI